MQHLILRLLLTVLFSTGSYQVAQAQTSYGQTGPCTVVTRADLAAARLAPVETIPFGSSCQLIWSQPGADGRQGLKFMHVDVISLPNSNDKKGDPYHLDLRPGVCAEILKERNPEGAKWRSCKELPGYGGFAILTGGEDRGEPVAMLMFENFHYRVLITALGVPGGPTEAVQDLGKVLAAKYR